MLRVAKTRGLTTPSQGGLIARANTLRRVAAWTERSVPMCFRPVRGPASVAREKSRLETMAAERVIVIDAEVMKGTPCFRGTRVPFKNLMDYLEGGQPLGEFLRQFPTVTRDMAVLALEEAKDSLLAKIA